MKKDHLKVSEIFKSIQGEGRHQGAPATFIRLSGCSRSCSWCDSKYHIRGKEISFDFLNKKMMVNSSSTFIFTGGEPLTQWLSLKAFLDNCYPFASGERFHLETNGDSINNTSFLAELLRYFNYIAISPKDTETAKKVKILIEDYKNRYCCGKNGFVDIKVVTDLNKVGVDMLEYATMLMPLTTYSQKADKGIKKEVWLYCIKHDLFYSDRLHISLWGKQRKI